MFGVGRRLVSEFREFFNSFLRVRDADTCFYLEQQMDRSALWPQPLLQLNPAFENGPLVDELVEQGVLDPRRGKLRKWRATLSR